MKLWLKILIVVSCAITIINGASNAIDKVKDNGNDSAPADSSTQAVMVVDYEA